MVRLACSGAAVARALRRSELLRTPCMPSSGLRRAAAVVLVAVALFLSVAVSRALISSAGRSSSKPEDWREIAAPTPAALPLVTLLSYGGDDFRMSSSSCSKTLGRVSTMLCLPLPIFYPLTTKPCIDLPTLGGDATRLALAAANGEPRSRSQSSGSRPHSLAFSALGSKTTASPIESYPTVIPSTGWLSSCDRYCDGTVPKLSNLLENPTATPCLKSWSASCTRSAVEPLFLPTGLSSIPRALASAAPRSVHSRCDTILLGF